MPHIPLDDETSGLLTAGLDTWQIPYTDRQIDQFLMYRDLLVEWNEQRMNLTRLIRPREIAVEHFLDSLSLLTALEIPAGSSLLDIGAGAGFPGLALKILRPDLAVTLLEATAKKLVFCQAVVDALGVSDVRMVHGRAESVPGGLARRGFDIVTARAVAPLRQLVAWCEPYLTARAGVIAAYKGSRARDEVLEAGPALSALGLSADVVDRAIPGSEKSHALVLCRRLPSHRSRASSR